MQIQQYTYSVLTAISIPYMGVSVCVREKWWDENQRTKFSEGVKHRLRTKWN